MSLFKFNKKKKSEEAEPACACNGNCEFFEADGLLTDKKNETSTSIDSVKVLGSGCASCEELFNNVKKALQSMGSDVAAEYITDMKEVVSYGVMSTPALVVNEQVVTSGRVLKPSDIEALLHKLGFSVTE